MVQSIFRPLYRSFMDSNISLKLYIGYLIIVLIPTVCITYAFYQENYTSLLQNHLSNEQAALEATAQTLTIRMNQAMSLIMPLEENSTLASYLDGTHTSVSESLYDYIRDIQPLFNSFSYKNDISDFSIYIFRDYVLVIQKYFLPFDELQDGDEILDGTTRFLDGIWRFEATENGDYRLVYYKALFNANYTAVTGLVRLETDPALFFPSFFPEAEDGNIYYLEDTRTQELYQYHDGIVSMADEQAVVSQEQAGSYILAASLNGFPFRFILAEDVGLTLHYNASFLILTLLLVLGLLTLMYFFVTRSITSRLLAFTKHIRTTDADALRRYDGDVFQDEVGVLIHTYNEMIDRINRLIRDNYQAELSRKDAEYYALQAQIKPHFLYNILENIRMNAEVNHAPQTADMLLALGKYMRYNLNSNMNAIPLEEELKSARNYLSILQIRMEGTLFYDFSIFTEIDDIFCPRFVLQPLLENSVKHGEKEDSPLHIHIRVEEAADGVLVIVEDDGFGMNPVSAKRLEQDLSENVLDGNSHVGLRNVNNRLISHSGSDCRLRIRCSSPGFQVSFLLKHTPSTQKSTLDATQ